MSEQSRRRFFQTTAALGALGALPGHARSRRQMLDILHDSVGMRLAITNLADGSRDTVRIAAVEDLPGHGLKQFVVRMEGAPRPDLSEGLYHARSESKGVVTNMHITPTQPGRYAAYFALLDG